MKLKSVHVLANIAALQQQQNRHQKIINASEVDLLEVTPLGLHIVSAKANVDVLISHAQWVHGEVEPEKTKSKPAPRPDPKPSKGPISFR